MRFLPALIALAIATQGGLAMAQTAMSPERQGLRASVIGRYVEAERAYRQGIARNPKYAPPYIGLGHALRDQKKYVEAEAAYRQAIALAPGYASYFIYLGNLLRDQMKYVEAEAGGVPPSGVNAEDQHRRSRC